MVIPTYNEAKNLPHVMGRLPAGLHEVIVVDGRSVDGTIEVAHTPEEAAALLRARTQSHTHVAPTPVTE